MLKSKPRTRNILIIIALATTMSAALVYAVVYSKETKLSFANEDSAITTNSEYADASKNDWWAPGESRSFPAYSEYKNSVGRLGIINKSGDIDSRNHPFFQPMGSNGRACVTCHQPSDGMSISVQTIRQRWDKTDGKDPLFSAIDGSDCPSLPQGKESSHSLILRKGLFRLALPWPPKPYKGKTVVPEFTIEVVRDSTGCNLDPQWGLKSDSPTVSVFRRPRPVINISHLVELPHGVPPHDKFFYNDKSLLPKNPDTQQFVSLQLMSDGRGISPQYQAVDASVTHLQVKSPLSKHQLRQIEDFELQLYAAQAYDNEAGKLTGPETPPGLGPEAMAKAAPGRLGNNPINEVFGDFSMWEKSQSEDDSTSRDFKASVSRGAKVFNERRFLIQDVGAYNDKGLGNPFKRSCGSGCHNTTAMGMDLAPGFMDLGLNNWPWQNTRSDLPLFKITCNQDAVPQSYLGREIYTHDPGRALITGKCRDVGATMTQQMRALAARPPYFANGSANNLRELVDFYDRRFNIGYTEQEKVDLVNFMRTL